MISLLVKLFHPHGGMLGLIGTSPDSTIIAVNQALEKHDWRTLTGFTVDGLVNYFGHRHVTNAYIAQDMQGFWPKENGEKGCVGLLTLLTPFHWPICYPLGLSNGTVN